MRVTAIVLVCLMLVMLMLIILKNFPVYGFFYLLVATVTFIYMDIQDGGAKDILTQLLKVILWLTSPFVFWWSL